MEDMEIDENNDFKNSKHHTLASFYPSSICASKGLDKLCQPNDSNIRIESNLDSISHSIRGSLNLPSSYSKFSFQRTDEEKLEIFRTMCNVELLQNRLNSVDLETLDIPEEVSEYADDILGNMRRSEQDHLPHYGYMKAQPDVNEKMRAILIDWLIEVHFKFKLLPETLFITVNIIDRFLEAKTIERQRLQLLGVTSMWIACKYEEIYAPELKDFVYITDNAYQQKDILKLEYEVLRTLEFNVTAPSSYRFLQRYAKLLGADDKAFNLAWYLIELPLIEYKMLKYDPSMISSAALFVSMKILKREIRWNDKMKNICYSENKIRPCAKDL
jgi:cyclin B